MPVTADNPGPYATSSAMLEVLNRYRNRGLATPINNEVLERVGVSASLSPRTLAALQVLDLIDNEGRPTQTLEGLRLAPEAEYQQRLADWLKAAYAEVFQFIDPSQDDETKIRDAFRNYRPHSQQSRMVTLFTGLCTAAGLMPERPRQTPRVASAPRPRSQARRPAASSGASSKRQSSGALVLESSGGLPPALAGLLASLPAEGRWTQSQRDKFVKTFEYVLDYSFTVERPGKDGDKENGGT
jgi:hypothetical protein